MERPCLRDEKLRELIRAAASGGTLHRFVKQEIRNKNVRRGDSSKRGFKNWGGKSEGRCRIPKVPNDNAMRQSIKHDQKQPTEPIEQTNMKYMMMVKADKNYETGVPPDPRLTAAIGKHAEEMAKAGVLLEMGGLLPSFAGARVRAGGGKLVVTDGPFAETKELIGGYAILRARSKEEAIKFGKDFMQIHMGVLGPSYEGELEIRQMFDPGDSYPRG